MMDTRRKRLLRRRRSEGALRHADPSRRPYVRPDHRTDDAIAFVAEPIDKPVRSSEDLAEELGEEFVDAATQGEQTLEERRSELGVEEVGGPFVETTEAEEFDFKPDPSNPPDATREPFPTSMRKPAEE